MADDRPGLIPLLTVEGAAEAASFYKRAFGAEEISRTQIPDGRLVQVVLRINGSVIYLSDMFTERGSNASPMALGGTTVTLHIETDAPDSLYAQAINAGATPIIPLRDMFWGQRFGKLSDPFGHRWVVATPQRPVPKAELDAGLRKYFR